MPSLFLSDLKMCSAKDKKCTKGFTHFGALLLLILLIHCLATVIRPGKNAINDNHKNNVRIATKLVVHIIRAHNAQ